MSLEERVHGVRADLLRAISTLDEELTGSEDARRKLFEAVVMAQAALLIEDLVSGEVRA